MTYKFCDVYIARYYVKISIASGGRKIYTPTELKGVCVCGGGGGGRINPKMLQCDLATA